MKIAQELVKHWTFWLCCDEWEIRAPKVHDGSSIFKYSNAYTVHSPASVVGMVFY